MLLATALLAREPPSPAVVHRRRTDPPHIGPPGLVVRSILGRVGSVSACGLNRGTLSNHRKRLHYDCEKRRRQAKNQTRHRQDLAALEEPAAPPIRLYS